MGHIPGPTVEKHLLCCFCWNQINNLSALSPSLFSSVIRTFPPPHLHPPTHTPAVSVLSLLAPITSVAPPPQLERPSFMASRLLSRAGLGPSSVPWRPPPFSHDESNLYLFLKKQRLSQCLRVRCGRQLWSYHLFLLSQKGFMALPFLTLPPVSGGQGGRAPF